jgi:membrane protein DedA with SNARE-associated domain
LNGGRALGSLVPRNKYLFVAALVALSLGVLEAGSVVELPFGAWFSALAGSVLSSSTLNDFMAKYGYASVFGLMALESASLPIPSEVVLPLAGYFVATGVMNLWVVVAVSTVASLVGALADYYLARWLGRPFVVGLLRLFRLHRNLLDRAEAWFARSAQWTVLVARFIPGLRTVISLPAGLFEMNLPRFVVMTVAGCFAWSVVLTYAGVVAGASQVSSTFASSSTVVDGLSALVAIVSMAYVIYYGYFALRSTRGQASPPSSVS